MAELLGIKRLSEGNSFGVVCPYCGDSRGKMNFRITKDGKPANTFHCFAGGCGAKGNMLTLYADMKGIYGAGRYKVAYQEIKHALSSPGSTDISSLRPTAKHECSEESLASLEKRDAVYRRLLSMLTLSEKHKAKLVDRGLTEEQIILFQFRTTPLSGTENIARKLLAEGYSLSGIPGFFVNGKRNWDVAFYPRNRGFLCPAFSVDGKIAGFQIRLDEPYDGRKYLWLSSSNKQRGTGSKSPVTFLGNPNSKIVRVTEGILKPTIAYAMSGYSFLGTPGVNQYKELEKALIYLKSNGLEEIQEYYDMDKLMDTRCFHDYKTDVCDKCWRTASDQKKEICEQKEQKLRQIQSGCSHLYEICSRLELRCVKKIWDLGQDGMWAGNLKGIDDYWCAQLMKRREYEDVNRLEGNPFV